MLFTAFVATWLSVASWTSSVAADLKITADHHSWGGVNYPMLQFFTPKHRDDTIRALVDARVRVVRLFSMSPCKRQNATTYHVIVRPDNQHPDVC
jgi:hypothetical protein